MTETDQTDVQEVWDEHKSVISDATTPAEMWEAADTCLETLIEQDDMGRPQIETWLRTIAESSRLLTITDVRIRYEQLLEEMVDTASNDLVSVDRCVGECLDKIIVTRNTDHRVDTSYQWHFVLPDDSPVVFTTEGRSHWHWNTFRENLFDDAGVNVGRPREPYREGDSWREFLTEIIQQRRVDREVEGPHTVAVEKISEHVEEGPVYGTHEAASSQGRPYMESEDDEKIWFSVRFIRRICSQMDIEMRGLQEELYARNLTVGGGKRVSQKVQVDGRNLSYWQLSADIGDPTEFKHEVEEDEFDIPSSDTDEAI